MRYYPADQEVVAQLEIVRRTLSSWMIGTVRLVGLAEHAEEQKAHCDPETSAWARALLAEVGDWQRRLRDWQSLDLSPRLKAEIRIVKAILDASMEEAKAAARQLKVIE